VTSNGEKKADGLCRQERPISDSALGSAQTADGDDAMTRGGDCAGRRYGCCVMYMSVKLALS
jgi:hypothetical protein